MTTMADEYVLARHQGLLLDLLKKIDAHLTVNPSACELILTVGLIFHDVGQYRAAACCFECIIGLPVLCHPLVLVSALLGSFAAHAELGPKNLELLSARLREVQDCERQVGLQLDLRCYEAIILEFCYEHVKAARLYEQFLVDHSFTFSGWPECLFKLLDLGRRQPAVQRFVNFEHWRTQAQCIMQRQEATTHFHLALPFYITAQSWEKNDPVFAKSCFARAIKLWQTAFSTKIAFSSNSLRILALLLQQEPHEKFKTAQLHLNQDDYLA